MAKVGQDVSAVDGTDKKGRAMTLRKSVVQTVLDSGKVVNVVVKARRQKKKTHHKERFLVIFCLFICNFIYVLMGGYLFRSTESTFQKEIRNNVCEFREQHCNRFETLYTYVGTSHETMVADAVFNFTKGLHRYMNAHGWDTQYDKEDVEEWKLSSSILYSIVVISTIGYGDITPVSYNGRLLTVIYALLGIPILLMFISALGEKFGLAFKLLYYFITCGKRKDRKKEEAAKQLKKEQNEGLQLPSIENDEAVVKKSKRERMREMLIPIHVSVLVMAMYILLGAVVFDFNETDWNFFESFYFAFISLTMIGFGDYVFGKKEDASESADVGKLIMACTYIIIGLGIVNMCLNHMAQTFVNNFHDIAVKLACIEDAPDDEQDDDDDAETHAESGSPDYSDTGSPDESDAEREKLMYKF